jgi:flagellar basal body-associated protein FliL
VAANASTNPFLAADPNASSVALPSEVAGASVDPFPTVSAESQTAGTSMNQGGSATVLIVSSIVAALFAVMLIGAFVMYRMKKNKQKDDSVDGKRASANLENGIFDAVPRANPKAEFTIEDFAAAPNGLYEEEDEKHVEKKTQIPQITTQFADHPANTTPLTPWGSKSGADSGLIFSSPYEHADTEYHISEDHVFGAPMYVVPRVGVAGINLTTPNAAAVAQNAQNSPTNPRHSMEWPAEFDDDPLNPEFGFEIPYGANMAAVDGIEEFPDVPTFGK